MIATNKNNQINQKPLLPLTKSNPIQLFFQNVKRDHKSCPNTNYFSNVDINKFFLSKANTFALGGSRH